MQLFAKSNVGYFAPRIPTTHSNQIYSGCRPTVTYGLGTCASQVKQRMEKRIHAFGYETVIWEDALVLPQSHLHSPAPAASATPDLDWDGVTRRAARRLAASIYNNSPHSRDLRKPFVAPLAFMRGAVIGFGQVSRR